jgi:hypothetical protein
MFIEVTISNSPYDMDIGFRTPRTEKNSMSVEFETLDEAEHALLARCSVETGCIWPEVSLHLALECFIQV